jgi:hypothetical protein
MIRIPSVISTTSHWPAIAFADKAQASLPAHSGDLDRAIFVELKALLSVEQYRILAGVEIDSETCRVISSQILSNF